MASGMVSAEAWARTATPFRSRVASAMAGRESVVPSRSRNLTIAESTGSCPNSHSARTFPIA